MNQTVIVYTSKGCPYCEQVIKLFKDYKIEVDERNISESSKDFQDWKSINPMGTPLTCYQDHQIIGFHKKKLEALIQELT